MEMPSNGGMLYATFNQLDAVYCVNAVLQGPFFSIFDLAALASDLDSRERQMMMSDSASLRSGDFLPDQSHNVSFDGDFSIQVLERALEVWDLQVIPLNSPVAETAQVDPEKENAFIFHLQDLWTCTRKVNGEWYNFDSMYEPPEHISKFELHARLDRLKKTYGWSIFLVRGNFPSECPISSKASNGFGQLLLPEDDERIVIASSQAMTTGDRNRTLEERTHMLSSQANEDAEDEDFKAAMAGSLMDSSSVTHAEPSDPPRQDTQSNK